MRLIQFFSILGALVIGLECATAHTATAQTPTTQTASAEPATSFFSKPGFYTEVKDGRLWVLRDGSKNLDEFKQNGELAKPVTRIGAGRTA